MVLPCDHTDIVFDLVNWMCSRIFPQADKITFFLSFLFFLFFFPFQLLRRDKGVDLVSFHECCLTGYTHLQHLGYNEILALAEPVWPPGPAVSCALVRHTHIDNTLRSVAQARKDAHAQGRTHGCIHPHAIASHHIASKLMNRLPPPRLPPLPLTCTLSFKVSALMRIAKEVGIAIGAGLLEREEDPSNPTAPPTIYNTYVVVDSSGKLAGSHRKLHAFISPHVSSGSNFTVFELFGAKIGILTCYDNNIPENGRCTALKGAEIVLMPHVTGGTPSTHFGRGEIDPSLWRDRKRPVKQPDATTLSNHFKCAGGIPREREKDEERARACVTYFATLPPLPLVRLIETALCSGGFMLTRAQ